MRVDVHQEIGISCPRNGIYSVSGISVDTGTDSDFDCGNMICPENEIGFVVYEKSDFDFGFDSDFCCGKSPFPVSLCPTL